MERTYTIICGSHYIRTTITAKASVVRRWVRYIKSRHVCRLRRSHLVVGLGVQWVPGQRTAATLQLCVGHNCLIFQLHVASYCPDALRSFLVNRDVIFVGLANHSDAKMLKKSKHDLRVKATVELRHVAYDFRGCSRNASMETLAEEILGMSGMYKDEGVGRSDWDDEVLSNEQVKYACHDAFLSFLIAKHLRVWNWEDDD